MKHWQRERYVRGKKLKKKKEKKKERQQYDIILEYNLFSPTRNNDRRIEKWLQNNFLAVDFYCERLLLATKTKKQNKNRGQCLSVILFL
jgi:hypothetical protein